MRASTRGRKATQPGHESSYPVGMHGGSLTHETFCVPPSWTPGASRQRLASWFDSLSEMNPMDMVTRTIFLVGTRRPSRTERSFFA